MKTQNKLQKGFTLIELMIVIAIVGILAAIALPAYQDYIVRAKVSEAVVALSEAKTTVAEYVASQGTFPTGSAADIARKWGVNQATRDGDILESVTIVQGTDTVAIVANVYDSVWDGGTPSATSNFQLVGTKSSTDATMIWICAPGSGIDQGSAVASKYLPANCR